jgi:hypothetical protein
MTPSAATVGGVSAFSGQPSHDWSCLISIYDDLRIAGQGTFVASFLLRADARTIGGTK